MAYQVNERASAKYTTTLKDEAGVAVALADVTTLTLWLYNAKTQEYINSRNAQNVLNTNQVTFHATSGLLTWALLPADNAIVGTDHPASELHIAVFRIVWSAGAKSLPHQIEIEVTNLFPITA